jgi:hypothetical protein
VTDTPPLTTDVDPERWFVPSFWGDIRLEPADDGKACIVIAEKLNDGEKKALADLEAQAHKKQWLLASAAITEGMTRIEAPMAKVAKVIAKVLKPDRKLVSAIVFADGQMVQHERHETAAAAEAAIPDKVLPPARAKPPKAGTTVAAPRLGCPAPDFENAELKAQRVLETFLLPAQIEDFRRYNRFVSIGHSGRRYMVTSRHARDSLALYHRSLYDLDAQTPLCVHDWDVPAPEEMLAIHVLLSLPGWEPYLRKLEGEDGERDASAGVPHFVDRHGRALN